MNGRANAVLLIAALACWIALGCSVHAQDKPTETAESPGKQAAPPAAAGDLSSVPIDDLRVRANANEIPAMEELGRRLIQGTGVAKDPQAGAGWLLHAAELGSAQSAFNVGVMYERGFVVERSSTKAVEWYRKAADSGLPAAKHNLALLLREGKGTPRDVKAAIDLLRSAARQGMAASMFTLGDIYEQGDGGDKDAAAALAWFAIAGEFERQSHRDSDRALGKTAEQRAQVLKRSLTQAELERAQLLAQQEFRDIVAALTPKPALSSKAVGQEPDVRPSAPQSPSPGTDADAGVHWPDSAADQVRAVQQALFDLKRLRDKPDGNLGPLTRAAIREFQKSVGMRPTGDATKQVYTAMILARHDVVAVSPLPTLPPNAVAAAEESKADGPKPVDLKPHEPTAIEPPAPATVLPATVEVPFELGQPPPPPPPPTSADVAAAAPKSAPSARLYPPKPAPVQVVTAKPLPIKVDTSKPASTPIDIGAPPPAPPPPTSIDIARAIPPDPNAWPPKSADQVKAIQNLLRELRLYSRSIDGQASAATHKAIREFQRMAGLKETGEPSKALFDSLVEMRKLMTPVGVAKPAATP